MRLPGTKRHHDRGRGGEPLASLMGGVPSLTIGLGSLVLIASYMIDRPIGPPGLYRFEYNASVLRIVVPSQVLLGMLVAGAWCGALGIVSTRRRRRDRRAITSIAGVVTCGAAYVLTWAWMAWAATL